MNQITPYLIFNGDCAQAMKFYQSVLGGELKMQTYGESGQTKNPEEKDLVIHADLNNNGMSFMASDADEKNRVNFGENIKMSLAGTDEAMLTKYFNGLGEGGKVDYPLKKEFWGDTFGMLTDKFGIHWMVNIGQDKK